MKKITLVLSVVLMAALLAFSAVAAPVDYETDTNADGGFVGVEAG